MTDTPEIAVGDLVEVLFAYSGPDGKLEPGGVAKARRRFWGIALEVGERLFVQIVDGEPPEGTGIGYHVAPYLIPGFASVRQVPSARRVSWNWPTRSVQIAPEADEASGTRMRWPRAARDSDGRVLPFCRPGIRARRAEPGTPWYRGPWEWIMRCDRHGASEGAATWREAMDVAAEHRREHAWVY